jgi:hypothetical protein
LVLNLISSLLLKKKKDGNEFISLREEINFNNVFYSKIKKKKGGIFLSFFFFHFKRKERKRVSLI